MDRGKYFLWILWLGFCCSLFSVAGDTYEEVEGSGLVLRSEPTGARVYINGIERGLTPLFLENISPGFYSIRITKEGYEDRRFRVTVEASGRLLVSITLEKARGLVLIRVDRSAGSPPEEKLPLIPVIIADGEKVSGPVLNLPVGWRTIRVRAFGWEEAVKTVYVSRGYTRELPLELVPASFRLSGATLSRRRFNPANAGSLGTTELEFEVSAAGYGMVTIEDVQGDRVFSRDLTVFDTWSQKLLWDGRSRNGQALPDGSYRILIETWSVPWDNSEPIYQKAELSVLIDSSISIHPISVLSGLGGLLFAPVPETIPRGSFQMEGGLLFGRAPAGGDPWNSLPYADAFRLAPVENVELAAAMNVLPVFGSDTVVYGALGSVKWQFFRSQGGFPLDMAGGLSYGWMQEGSLSPFGAGAGVQLFFPIAYWPDPRFSCTLTPALIWTGEEGYPSEAVPRILLSAGGLFTSGYLMAGISIRSEYRFRGSATDPPHAVDSPAAARLFPKFASWFGPLLIGAEFRIFPPPSNLVFSILGGGWFFNGEAGAFGGFGIGLIY
jgi:hypothetical protein